MTINKDESQMDTFPLHIVGRHGELTEAMKQYAVEKLKKIERFGGRVIDAHIIVDRQKFWHSVEYVLLIDRTKVRVEASDADYYAAVDAASAKLCHKIDRYHERLTAHHNRPLKEIELSQSLIRSSNLSEINDAIEEQTLREQEAALKPGEVVHRERGSLKTLTQEEAIMRMELSEEPCLVFRSEEDQKLKILARRFDGNYDLTELPE